MAGTFNFSLGAKISCRLVQKWPRYKKKNQKWTLKTIFLKNPPGFLAFEKSSSKLTSNRQFWLKQIYRDIKFILRGLPGRCGEHIVIESFSGSSAAGQIQSEQMALHHRVCIFWLWRGLEVGNYHSARSESEKPC